MATKCASENLILTYQNTRRHITQYYNLNSHPWVHKFPNQLVANSKFQNSLVGYEKKNKTLVLWIHKYMVSPQNIHSPRRAGVWYFVHPCTHNSDDLYLHALNMACTDIFHYHDSNTKCKCMWPGFKPRTFRSRILIMSVYSVIFAFHKSPNCWTF